MKKVVIIVDKGVQDEEYVYPYYRLQEESDIQLEVATRTEDNLFGKYGIPIRRTMLTKDLNADEFDCVIIPGGWESPEKVRQDPHALKFIAEMNSKGKVIAAICHGPWVLISAGVTKGKKMTCFQGMKDDLINSGAFYQESGLVVDGNFITSPHYRNNAEFMKAVILATRLSFEPIVIPPIIDVVWEVPPVINFSTPSFPPIVFGPPPVIKESFGPEFNDVVVKKPWGHEFLVMQNNNVGVWYLHLNPGEQTSLHSHPNKKTGLIVLSGKAEVSFLNGKHQLNPGDKIMIRNGVFHSTKAIDGVLEMIEVETPNDKHDIIRLQDSYGRSGEPYESSEHHIPKKENWDLLAGHKVGKCLIQQKTFTNHNELINCPSSKIVMLDGKLVYKNNSILTAGDVVDNVVLNKLASQFESVLPISALVVT